MRSSHHIISSLTAQTFCRWYAPSSLFHYWAICTLTKLRGHFFTFILCPLHQHTIEFIIIQLSTKLCTVCTCLLQEKNQPPVYSTEDLAQSALNLLLQLCLKFLHPLHPLTMWNYLIFPRCAMISQISMPLHMLFPLPQISLTYIVPHQPSTYLSSPSLRCFLESLVDLETPHFRG